MKDKEIYPDIFTQGTEGHYYYTNSCCIPVNQVKSIDSTMKHQEALQTQFTGGVVNHIYLEGAITGKQAKEIIKQACTHYRLPYLSISPISRFCKEHGYVKEHVDKCPICGEKLMKYQRITGYTRCVDNFNDGKKAEFEDRVQL